MRKYRLVAKKGEGTFSEVLKAQNVKDGRYHAIKCMKNRFDSIDQVNNLREIQALRRLSPHEHVVALEEVLYDQPTGRLALVFELMDANLYELIKGRKHYLNPNLVKSYMWQLMKALDHMHKKGIFHRDIKPENILIESTSEVGRGLKLADFGSCRGIYSKQPYTEYISTRWYRAPECLLTDGYYGPEMDLWGAGCVMFEITGLFPLFPGTNEVDQISRIHKVLGTPSADIINKFKSKGASHISLDFIPQKGVGIPQLIQHAAPEAIDLIERLLRYDATERITAREAMRHAYFMEVRDAEAKQAGAGAMQSATAASSVTHGQLVPASGVGCGGGGGGGVGNSGAAMTNMVVGIGGQSSTVSLNTVASVSKAYLAASQDKLPTVRQGLPSVELSKAAANNGGAAPTEGSKMAAGPLVLAGIKASSIPVVQTTMSSLPPIAAAGGAGGKAYRGGAAAGAGSGAGGGGIGASSNGVSSMTSAAGSGVGGSGGPAKKTKKYRPGQTHQLQSSHNPVSSSPMPVPVHTHLANAKPPSDSKPASYQGRYNAGGRK